MKNYHFVSNKSAFGKNEIHLLRNGFPYESFTYEEIISFRISKMRFVKNWILVMGIGFLFSSGGLVMIIRTIVTLLKSEIDTAQLRYMILLFSIAVLLLTFGLFSVKSSFRWVDSIEKQLVDKKYCLPLDGLQGKLSELEDLLKKNILS